MFGKVLNKWKIEDGKRLCYCVSFYGRNSDGMIMVGEVGV